MGPVAGRIALADGRALVGLDVQEHRAIQWNAGDPLRLVNVLALARNVAVVQRAQRVDGAKVASGIVHV